MINKVNNDFGLKNKGISNALDTVDMPRHRWYFYKEGFSPKLVEKAIDYTEVKKNELIIDPFNGSGTTTLTAATLGYNSLGIEVNPFTSFLSDAKVQDVDVKDITSWETKLISFNDKSAFSSLLKFSTFSKKEGLSKWLFNDSILNAFENKWVQTAKVSSPGLQKILRLALISSAMHNCNATRDGKCLRYRTTWNQNNFDENTFNQAFSSILTTIKEDIQTAPIRNIPTIDNKDSRSYLTDSSFKEKFKLCVTSPPYLNTFDYTDIYRPELFLGKFITEADALYNLRLKTVRSHVQAQWKFPRSSNFGTLYEQTIKHIKGNTDKLMHKNIPMMVQAYFEDMLKILKSLKNRAADDAQIWFVVSNSAYANKEVPVDLIIAELGGQAGWYLKEIGVLRHLKRRKTKHSPDVNELRESVIIFSASKPKLK